MRKNYGGLLLKLKKISIIMIIFIAFMSIATASAMDDSSSVSLDDSSNYNASGGMLVQIFFPVRIQYPLKIVMIWLQHLMKNLNLQIWILNQRSIQILMRELAIPTVLDQIQMFYLVLTLMYCLAAVQMCSLQASL